MRRSFITGCAAVLIATAATAGCTASTPSEPSGSAARSTSRIDDTARELTDAERILLQNAEQSLIKDCMRQAGFRYWVGPLPTADDLKGGGYVLTDVGWARLHGYGSRLRERLQAAHAADRNHAYVNALPRSERVRYSAALDGQLSGEALTAELPGGGTVRAPRHSCLATAKDRLYGDFEAWFRAENTAMNLTPLYASDLVKDERFGDAVKDWSACMRKAGHAYSDPPEARKRLPELTKGLSTEKAYAVEVDLAVAEATCATGTCLAGTARKLEAEYRGKELQRYGDDIAAYRRMSLDALSRAEDITGSTA